MATPRKPFVRLETSMLREPWPHDVKGTLCLLMCIMGDRWARDRLTAEEAMEITLSPGQLSDITGRTHLRHARLMLASCARVVTLEINTEGRYTHVKWFKFPKTQELESRGREFKTRRKPESAPAPSPSPSPAPAPAEEHPVELLQSSPRVDSPPKNSKPPKPEDPLVTTAVLNLIRVLELRNRDPDVPTQGQARFHNWCEKMRQLKGKKKGTLWSWDDINGVIDWMEFHERGDFAWPRDAARSATKFHKHMAQMYDEKEAEKRRGNGVKPQMEPLEFAKRVARGV